MPALGSGRRRKIKYHEEGVFKGRGSDAPRTPVIFQQVCHRCCPLLCQRPNASAPQHCHTKSGQEPSARFHTHKNWNSIFIYSSSTPFDLPYVHSSTIRSSMHPSYNPEVWSTVIFATILSTTIHSVFHPHLAAASSCFFKATNQILMI